MICRLMNKWSFDELCRSPWTAAMNEEWWIVVELVALINKLKYDGVILRTKYKYLLYHEIHPISYAVYKLSIILIINKKTSIQKAYFQLNWGNSHQRYVVFIFLFFYFFFHITYNSFVHSFVCLLFKKEKRKRAIFKTF